MRASTAYLAGAGTIVAAIAMGLGGGLIAGNIMNPTSPKQGPDTTRLERSAEPVAAANTASEYVPYLAGSQAFGAAFAASVQAEPQRAAANAEPSAQTAAASESKPVNASAAQPASPAEQASGESNSAPEGAYARAKDADLKRAASERRRAERRQQWAERRRHEMREPRELRGRTDWDDVARSVRADSDSREFAASPRVGVPQIRLFGPDDE
jgi:hypothetical protein